MKRKITLVVVGAMLATMIFGATVASAAPVYAAPVMTVSVNHYAAPTKAQLKNTMNAAKNKLEAAKKALAAAEKNYNKAVESCNNACVNYAHAANQKVVKEGEYTNCRNHYNGLKKNASKKQKEQALKSVNKAKKALDSAKTKLTKAEKTRKAAQKALASAEKTYKAKLEAYHKAAQAYEAAVAAYSKAK